MQGRPDLLLIINGCISGHRDSQKLFYQTYYGYAKGMCMRYSTQENDVVEIVNDGFLKVFKSLSTFSPPHTNLEASLKGWMKRIMINTAIDHLRKNKHRFLVSEMAESQFDTAEVGESSIESLTYKEILAIIQRLSPVYRLVFNLYVMDGFKHEEIAEQLHISVGASKSNLAKARGNIKKMLEEADTYYEQKVV